jgi:hypothetical protein
MLARTPFAGKLGQRYRLELSVMGDKLTLAVDGKELLTASDGTYHYGMGGLRMASAGRMSVARLEIEDFA